MSIILNRLKTNSRVDHVDDERSIGNSIIVTLRKGWTFDQLQDNRVCGADTASEAARMVRAAHVFAGPFED